MVRAVRVLANYCSYALFLKKGTGELLKKIRIWGGPLGNDCILYMLYFLYDSSIRQLENEYIQVGHISILLELNQDALVDTNKEVFEEFLGQLGTKK